MDEFQVRPGNAITFALRADRVRLTTAMTEQAAELIALRADRVRLTTELAARDERDKAPKEQPRRRTKAVAA